MDQAVRYARVLVIGATHAFFILLTLSGGVIIVFWKRQGENGR